LIGNINALVLDEPTTGIDISSKKKIYTLIKDHVERADAGVIISTHCMSEAE
jgi:ABC-type multidrug transport system ATPase subunit